MPKATRRAHKGCATSKQGSLLYRKKINNVHNFFAAATFVAALMVNGGALAEPSTFTAATDDDNNGYNSKFTLCSDVTSDTGTNDILRLLAHGTASYLFVSN